MGYSEGPRRLFEKSTTPVKSELLTTGDVARRCGVTPDAVLKWIRKGRLQAVRTSGGHFRVARESLEALGAIGRAAQSGGDVNSPADSLSGLKHCWEYFCRDMVPPEACEECIVHRARIEKCYEVAKLGQTIGHSRTFCRTTCEECSFFRACHGLAPIILVVTTDKALSGRLTGQADSRNVVLRFARSGYESSMLVETFHPSVVVLDSALGEVRDGRLVDSIVHDERIAGVRIIIALRNRDRVAPRQGVSVMSAPFTLEKIERERGKP
ncbi:MAG: hypothetical protein A2V70_01590 [Planctomycetes bacterium RBG_13_63_9]|nr:MAG: hypothetical protein A2V70_01590 [Planctomycetes bacterium RBG_13_63_9]